MKKHFFLAASAATMLVGCMDEGNNAPGFGEGDPSAPLTSLSIRLGNGSSFTRSLEGRGKTTEGTNQLSNAHVFILDATGAGVIDYAPVFGDRDLEAIRGTGWNFPEPIPADSRVYILGNVPTDYNRTVRDLETLAAIDEFTSDIWTQVDYNLATMANVDGDPVEMSASSSGSATVSVEVAPVISRLELHSLRGGGNINGFSVTGVFLTGYHAAYTYGGGVPAGSQPIDNSQALATNGGMTGDDMDYPAIAQGTPLTAAMTGNRIWAYNVAARTLPLLVVRLENVLIGSHLQAGPLYLTVSSYNGMTEFLPGKIYRISALSFTEQNLAIAPVADGGISAEATEWDFDDIVPDINTPGARIAVTPTAPLTDWLATDSGATTQAFGVTLPAELTAWSVAINQGSNTYFTATENVPGGTFTLAPTSANTSVFARTATVRVNGTGADGATGTSNPIQIRQLAAAAQMAASPSQSSLTFISTDDSTASTGSITFDSNVAFSVALTGADADKFTLTGAISAATPDAMTSYTINVVPVAANGSAGAYNAVVSIRNTDGHGASQVDITVTHNN